MNKSMVSVKKLHLVFGLLLLSALCVKGYSQEEESNVFFLLKSDWSATKDMKHASYFMQLVKESDTSYVCRYYNKFGPLIRQEAFLDSGLTIPNGRFCWYDSRGNLDSTAWVSKGRKTSWTYFDDSLRPLLSMAFGNGRILERRDYRSNNYMDATGISSNLKEKETAEKNAEVTEAIFGQSASGREWQDYIKSHIKLTDRFLSIFKTGIYPVTISFDVDQEGKTEDIYLSRSCEWSADAEVLEAVMKSPAWQPAVKNEKRTATHETQTITFAPVYQANGNTAAILPRSDNSILITQGGSNAYVAKFIDTAGFYQKAKLKDNFYLHINGNWMLSHPLPESWYRWSNMEILTEINLERLNELYQDAALHAQPGTPERLLGDLYRSGMDTNLIESIGYSPIKDEMQQLESLTSENDVLDKIAQLQTVDGIGNCLFHFAIQKDDKDPEKYIVAFRQSGLTLPSLSYYLSDDGRSKFVQDAYLQYLTDMFKLVGFSKSEASSKARSVFQLETAIAGSFFTGKEIMDPEKTYHKYTLKDFIATTQIDWVTVLNNLQIETKTVDNILVNSPSYFKSIHTLLDNYSLKDWTAYLQWKLIYNMAPYLNKAMVNRAFAFSKILNGQQGKMEQSSRVASIVDGMFDDISGKLYVDRYFSDSSKKKISTMVENLKYAFAERIKNLSWMSADTRHEALKKLNAITDHIGSPENVQHYEGLVIRPDDFAGNIRRIKAWYYKSMISRDTSEINEEWAVSAATVNAFYNPLENAIFLPAGILQPPYFDANADDAINYGSIGSIIGHELTHGFDSQGSKYDKDGRLYNWWNDDDTKNFKERVDDIIDQYDKLEVGYNISVDGTRTINENIADMGGLAIAYDAFKRTVQGQSTGLIDGLTPDQRFFISYAQCWRSNETPEISYQDILIEPHAPAMFRCNVPLSNMDAFYQAFGIEKGDNMFKSNSKRTSIW
jgi:putative endopeptidase